MRILLTGATGFVGSNLLPLLTSHDVMCLTRDPAALPAETWIRPLAGDLMSPSQWKAEVERFAPQWCIHAAWQGLPDYSLPQCRANLDASLRLLEILAAAQVKRVTVLGSCWEYGDAAGQVAEDAAGINCGLFASTKIALHSMLAALARQASFDYRWARVFFVYGPGQRASSLLPLANAAYAAGRKPDIRNPSVVQDFIHIDDVARAIIAVTAADIGSGVFNIGSGRPTSVAEMVNHVAAYHGQPPQFVIPRAPELGFWAGTNKLTQATGWTARVSMSEGIERTLSAMERKP